MRFYFLIIFNLLFIRLSCQSQQELSTQLDSYFTALSEINQFHGNVIIAQHGKVLLDKTYKMPAAPPCMHINSQSQFIMASVSKVYIRYCLFKLIEEKKISLSDKLSSFIPDFPHGDQISLSHLLYHQSGLPRELKNYESYDSLSLKKIVELAKKETLLFEPGTQTFYSNIGFSLLHSIIDQVSPNGYLDYIQKKLFKPFCLKHTGEFNSSRHPTHFVSGFLKEGGEILVAPPQFVNRFESGNIYTTISDFYRFASRLTSGKHLKKDLAIKMFGSDSTLVQAGGRPGYRAYFYHNLKSGVLFLFLSNYSDVPVPELSSDIINLLTGKPYNIPKKIQKKEIPVSIDILKRYTGTYALVVDPSQKFTFQLKENKMYIIDSEGVEIPLHPDSETSFFDQSDSKDGYYFQWNQETSSFELVIVSTGLSLKTKKIL